MADLYKTSDGKIHDSIGSALAHQDIVNTENANRESQFSSSPPKKPLDEWTVWEHKFSNGDVYTGNVARVPGGKQGLPSGYGKMVFADGSIYDGWWDIINGSSYRHGNGRMFYPDGSFKEGEWENGKLVKCIEEGKATTPSSTSSSKAEIMPPNFTGKGKFTDEYGTLYEGDFVNGELHGKGKRINSGRLEEGDFEKGYLIKGKSIENDIIFEGVFNNYPKNLKVTYPNGDIYEGELGLGAGVVYKPNGKGTMTYPDGRVEEGKWKDGEFKGKGFLGGLFGKK